MCSAADVLQLCCRAARSQGFFTICKATSAAKAVIKTGTHQHACLAFYVRQHMHVQDKSSLVLHAAAQTTADCRADAPSIEAACGQHWQRLRTPAKHHNAALAPHHLSNADQDCQQQLGGRYKAKAVNSRALLSGDAHAARGTAGQHHSAAPPHASPEAVQRHGVLLVLFSGSNPD